MQVSEPKKGYKFVDVGFGKLEEIPEEWNLKKLGSMISIEMGQAPPSNSYNKDGNGTPFVKVTEFGTKFPQEKVWTDNPLKFSTKNDVLLCVVGSVGEINLGIDCAIGRSVAALKHNPKLISQNFLFYVLHRNLKYFKKSSQGSSQGVITKDHIKKLDVILPPLLVQQKISSILSNVDDTLEKTNQLIQKTEILKKGLTQKLFTKGIGHNRFKKIDWVFGKQIEIPEEWNIEKAENVCLEIVVGIVVKPASLYSKTGVPCLRSFNIKEDNLLEKDIVKISEKSNDKNHKSKLKKGDVLIVRTGNAGTACVVPPKFEGGNCVDLIIARPETRLSSHFLSRFVNSEIGKNQVLKTQAGSIHQHFNIGAMKKMKILIPSFSEQKQIASILSNIDSQINKEKLQKKNLELLKKGLMQKLLTGQIRVKI